MTASFFQSLGKKNTFVNNLLTDSCGPWAKQLINRRQTQKSNELQDNTQGFEKGGANLRVFTKGDANLKKILILRPKLEV